jgi:transposase
VDNSSVQSAGIEESTSGVTRRRHRTVEEKRRIVQESLKPGASVAVVARRFDVNANQIFTWRRQLRRGALVGKQVTAGEVRLLPVSVQEVGAAPTEQSARLADASLHAGRIEIEFGGGRRLCIQGRADPATLSAVIRELSQP